MGENDCRGKIDLNELRQFASVSDKLPKIYEKGDKMKSNRYYFSNTITFYFNFSDDDRSFLYR